MGTLTSELVNIVGLPSLVPRPLSLPPTWPGNEAMSYLTDGMPNLPHLAFHILKETETEVPVTLEHDVLAGDLQ